MFDPTSGKSFESVLPNVQLVRAEWETPRCGCCLTDVVTGQLVVLVLSSTLCAPCAVEDGLLRQA